MGHVPMLLCKCYICCSFDSIGCQLLLLLVKSGAVDMTTIEENPLRVTISLKEVSRVFRAYFSFLH